MLKLLSAYNIGLATGFPLIDAVLANLQQGKIFEDESGNELFYIIHKAGFSYIVRDDHTDYSPALLFLLESKDIPGYFHIYDPPTQIIHLCNQNTEEVNIRVRERVQLKFNGHKKLETLNPPQNYRIEKINPDNFDKLSIFNLSLGERFWKSKSDFEANSFGFCIFNEADVPLSICYAACVVNNTAEIDVATLSEYQRKGLAKLVVNAFVEYCINDNIVANWDCFQDNHGSLKTAESIGFERTMSYNFLSIFNKRKNHEKG
jgi:GNAT superfamily N-acetyltransferase